MNKIWILNLLRNIISGIEKLPCLYIVKYQKRQSDSLRFLHFDRRGDIQFGRKEDAEEFIPYSLLSLSTLIQAMDKFPYEKNIRIIEIGREVAVWDK